MASWYTGDEEMKAKVGQLLYNLYLTDRLKAEVLEKLYSKNQISLRIDLGKDRDGKDIIMDILISRITPQVKAMKEDEGIPEPAQSDKASEGSVQPTS